MLPAARDAEIDFIRLAGEEPSSLYFEDFLRGGFQAWPSQYRERFPGLATWQGVGGLKKLLRELAGAPGDWDVLLASRSLSLLKIGASCLFRVCRNVLTTDLSWPTYQRTVVDKAIRTGNRVTETAIRGRVLNGGWNAVDVAGHLASEFIRRGCDGLFLPAVDHLGIRMPIRQIVKRIEPVAEVRFCLIDAAQALCHVPLDDSFAHADFVVAGSHKWMGAYLPTGIAFFGQPRSRKLVFRQHSHQSKAGRMGDPLSRLTEQLSYDVLDGRSETANISNLFACAAAAESHASRISCDSETLAGINQAIQSTPFPIGHWCESIISPDLRSRIRLFRQADGKARSSNAVDVRQQWLAAGCVVSGFNGGHARLAFPRSPTSRIGTLA